MILALNLWIGSNVFSGEISSTTTTSTTTSSSAESSTPPNYDHSKRKGSDRKNDKGKHFPKRLKDNFFDSFYQNSYNNFEAEDVGKCSRSCSHQNCVVANLADLRTVKPLISEPKQQQQTELKNKYFGYVLNYVDSDQMLSFKEELPTILKMIIDETTIKVKNFVVF